MKERHLPLILILHIYEWLHIWEINVYHDMPQISEVYFLQYVYYSNYVDARIVGDRLKYPQISESHSN